MATGSRVSPRPARRVVRFDAVPLDAEGARRFYDRLGRWQDTQRLYEDAATRRLVAGTRLGAARSVFVLGCGTGRFAASLLRDQLLPGDARYLGVDVSPVMVALARERLAPWAARAEVRLLEPPARALPGADGSFDRFLATYVFDLLSEDDSRALVGEAHRLLAPAGLLGLVSLTHGRTTLSRSLSGVWGVIATRWPELVGGCRPTELEDLLDAERWELTERDVITRWGVPSEVIVASRRESP
jgi:SAM-dependent methyltransferase